MTSSQVNHPLFPDSRPQVIRSSVENSLRRLGTDYVDLYYQLGNLTLYGTRTDEDIAKLKDMKD